ncbi:hypothetical protein [Lentzea sp. NEAU-D7]|uniref:hypothetical protein n=1 Tax=Lentzea sp. NEAU-D7 TaxID=2994667 RepID=UPI00224B2748|nr:hypothetical protein [Lentzea sp. NEAU-D7]MCX2954757.1 hypothetical protein [Lentzea sp. NEAU-D7]
MKRLVAVLVLALAACSPTPPGLTRSSTVPPTTMTTTSTPGKPDQAGQVQQVFSDFTKALGDKNGDAAAAVMTSAAIIRWETYRVHALKSTEADLAGLPVAERAIVYGLRATAGPSLRTATGRTVLITAVQQGLVTLNTSTKLVNADGTTTVKETTPVLKNLVLGADTATGELASNDPTVPAIPKPIKFTFLREGEDWKIDPVGVTDLAAFALEELAARKGVTADQLLIEAFTGQYGAARVAEIRKPLDG